MRHLIENRSGVRARQGAIGYDPVQIYQYLRYRYVTYHAPITRMMFVVLICISQTYLTYIYRSFLFHDDYFTIFRLNDCEDIFSFTEHN